MISQKWPIRIYVPREMQAPSAAGKIWDYAQYHRLYVRRDGDICYRDSKFIATVNSATAGPCYTEWIPLGFWYAWVVID